MNVVVISGRLAADPELKTTPNGKSVCSVNVAVQDDFNRELTHWLRLVTWGKNADFLSKYFHKGSKIIAIGRLTQRTYQDKNGNNRESIEIVADRLEFGESKKEREKQYNSSVGNFQEIENEDDLPF